MTSHIEPNARERLKAQAFVLALKPGEHWTEALACLLASHRQEVLEDFKAARRVGGV